MKYHNAEDVNMRLSGTIVSYEGKPVYVAGPLDDSHVAAYHLRDLDNHYEKRKFQLKFNSPKLDVSSVPLGWVNSEAYGNYVSRQPARRQKQGFDPKKAVVFSLPHSKLSFAGFDHNYARLADCIEGIYPSFEEVLDTHHKRKANLYGFERYFAASPTHDPGITNIYHMRNLVGVFYTNDKYGFLLKEYDHPFMRKRLSNYMELSNE